jgi:WD40 repeat protein
VRELLLTPDGQTLVASGARHVTLWDLAERELRAEIVHNSTVSCVALSPDGETLALRLAGELVLHDLESGEERDRYPLPEDSFLSGLAYSGDAQRLRCALKPRPGPCRTIAVHELDLATEELHLVSVHEVKEPYRTVTWAAGEWTTFAVLLARNRVVVSSLGRLPQSLTPPESLPVLEVRFSPDGRLLAVHSARAIHLWDVRAADWHARIRDSRKINGFAFSAEGRILATASNDGTVRLYDLASLQVRVAYDWQIGPVAALLLAADGLRAAAAGVKGGIVVWDMDDL